MSRLPTRGFLVVHAQTSPCSSDFAMSFTDGRVSQTSSAQQGRPSLISTTADAFNAGTSNASVTADVSTSVTPSPSMSDHDPYSAAGPSVPMDVQLETRLVVTHFLHFRASPSPWQVRQRSRIFQSRFYNIQPLSTYRQSHRCHMNTTNTHPIVLKQSNSALPKQPLSYLPRSTLHIAFAFVISFWTSPPIFST